MKRKTGCASRSPQSGPAKRKSSSANKSPKPDVGKKVLRCLLVFQKGDCRSVYMPPTNELQTSNQEVADMPNEESDQLPTLICRSSPHYLIDAINNLNVKQREEVNEMGLSKLLDLKIKEVPTKLGYWLLENFDPRSCSLVLADKTKLHITQEDVWITLGIPKEPTIIKRKTRHQECSVLDEWIGRVGKVRSRILPKDVYTVLLQEVDGGVWFRRHFLVLMVACLFDNSTNGYVIPQTMENFEDVSTVHSLNWCEFVIRVLIEHHLKWSKNKRNPFVGPILFLMTFYVDRVVLYTRSVPRAYPTMKEWTFGMLKQRQKIEIEGGGFGAGYVEERYIPSTEEVHVEVPQQQTTAGLRNGPDELAEKVANDMHLYTDKVMEAAKSMANKMTDLITLINEAPKNILANESFKKIVEASQLLIEICVTGKSSSNGEAGYEETNFSQLTDDDLWQNQQWLEGIEKIETAMKFREQLRKAADAPSFSLGLTQMGMAEMQNIERPHTPPTTHGQEMQPDSEAEDTRLVTPPQVQGVRIVEGFSIGDLPVANENLEKTTDVEENLEEHAENDQQDIAIGCKTGERKQIKSFKGKNMAYLSRHTPRGKGKMVDHEEKEIPKRHEMVRRNEKEKKKSRTLMSPYNVRIIDPTEKLDKEEKEVFYWIFHNENAALDEFFYFDNRVTLKRGDLHTLASNAKISDKVIDVWSSVLNHKEKMHSPNSSSRFFFTTFPCMFTVVDAPSGCTQETTRHKFIKRVNTELANYENIDLCRTDLVFFPIYLHGHAYVICFNIRKSEVHVIGSTEIPNNENLFAKYASVPTNLVNMFCDLLGLMNATVKAKEIRRKKINTIKMHGTNATRTTDAGIYVMRHMETYMGETSKNWQPCFKKTNNKQLHFLRAKYCKAILAADCNYHWQANLHAASYYLQLSSTSGSVDIDKLVMTWN